MLVLCVFLASFAQHTVLRFLHFIECISSSFLLPGNIPLCGQATICLYIFLLMDV